MYVGYVSMFPHACVILCGSSGKESRVTISGIAVLGAIFATDTMGLIAVYRGISYGVFILCPHNGGAGISVRLKRNVNLNYATLCSLNVYTMWRS